MHRMDEYGKLIEITNKNFMFLKLWFQSNDTVHRHQRKLAFTWCKHQAWRSGDYLTLK